MQKNTFPMMTIDTVSARPAICVKGFDGDVLKLENLPMGRKQSETLTRAFERLLTESHINLKDLRGLAVVTGPGSFTGIRTGLSFFKGLAYGLDIPLYGVHQFDLLKTCCPENETGLIVLESGRDEKFIHCVENRSLIGEPLNVAMNEIPSEVLTAATFVISDCAEIKDLHLEIIESKKSPAEILIDLEALTEKAIEPYYIRPADTSTPKEKKVS